MDAITHLVRSGTDPNKIKWIMPNDSLLLDRDWMFGGKPTIIKGGCYPFDAKIPPKNAKCATLSREEYQMCKSVNIIRKGRI